MAVVEMDMVVFAPVLVIVDVFLVRLSTMRSVGSEVLVMLLAMLIT